MSFEIRIEPPISSNEGECNTQFPPESYEKVLNAVPEEYDLVYLLNEREFGYYPSNVITTIEDLDTEIANFKTGESHYISLSGYPVLYAKIEFETVRFFDPIDESLFPNNASALATEDVLHIVNKLSSTRDIIAKMINRRMRSKGDKS